MPSFIDLVGQTFGRLNVISRAPNLKNNVAFNCLCICGKTCTIRARSLKAGTTQSCGCYQKESIIVRGEERKLTEAEQEISKARKLEYAYRRRLEKIYGLTIEEFAAKRAEQNDRCAICTQVFTKTPNVDHNHETGQVRKLLCGPCNIAIGLVKEDINILQAAITYLKSFLE